MSTGKSYKVRTYVFFITPFLVLTILGYMIVRKEKLTSSNEATNESKKVSKNTQLHALLENRIPKKSKNKRYREISVFEHDLQVQKLISNSEWNEKFGEFQVFYDLDASFSKPEGGHLFIISGKYVLKKRSPKNLGIILNKNKIGIITGEIIFSNSEYDEVSSFVQEYGASVVRADKKMDIVIAKVTTSQMLSLILKDNRFEAFNGIVDAQYTQLQYQ